MPNRLINEKSPYLLQHAHNPVDWYPWSEEAFIRAKEEDKPIFLSIGYSSCHWCHVMEKESFNDPDVAALLNRYFVSIKVDREERPDIDHLYMTFCVMTGNRGGWPLNVFLTPDKKPFFAMTYIPKKSRGNLVGMLELLPAIYNSWKSARHRVEEVSASFLRILSEKRSISRGLPDTYALEATYRLFDAHFDRAYGGFGQAPKFPTAHQLLFLMRYFYRTNEANALNMVQRTLTKMRLGGMYDHVGGGFHRYSTDSKWLLPHFEKMLYDQAMLIIAYLEAYQLTSAPIYLDTVLGTIAYLKNRLLSPYGPFYAGEDADSEGVECKYYVWAYEELKDLLSPVQFELLKNVSNLKKEGNYLEEATSRPSGKNIIHLKDDIEILARDLGSAPTPLMKDLKEIFKRLLDARNKKVPPALDYKVLTDWNSLLIVALTKAGALLDHDYLSLSQKAYDFILSHFEKEHELGHSFVRREQTSKGILDDYAFFLWASLELFSSLQNREYLDTAQRLAHILLDRFYDHTEGNFFLTPESSSDILVRTKNLFDAAIPSGNSVALFSLAWLYHLTGDQTYLDAVQKSLSHLRGLLEAHGTGISFGLVALDMFLGPVTLVDMESSVEDAREVIRSLRDRFLPRHIYKCTHDPSKGPSFKGHICKDNVCGPLLSSKDDLIKTLRETNYGPG